MRLLPGVIVAVLLAGTGPAFAHLPIAGVGGFYGGLLHPILVPPHALGLVALGLLLGRQQVRRVAMLSFSVALVAGLAAIALAIEETQAGDVLLATTAVIGVLVAAAWSPPHPVGCVLAAITGATLALDSPPDTISIEEGNVILLGTALGACIALAAVVELRHHLTRPWQLLGVRIAGSWIAASAILVLALRIAAA